MNLSSCSSLMLELGAASILSGRKSSDGLGAVGTPGINARSFLEPRYLYTSTLTFTSVGCGFDGSLASSSLGPSDNAQQKAESGSGTGIFSYSSDTALQSG